MKEFIPLAASTKEQLLTALCSRFEDAIFILDANLRYMWVNAAYEVMIGHTETFLAGRPLGIYAQEFLGEKERRILKDIAYRLDEHGYYQNNLSMTTRYGQTLDCHLTFRRIELEDSYYHIGMVKDTCPKIETTERVSHLSNYDELTQLPNRRVFLSQTSELLLDSYREVVVVRLNIDHYRMLANTLGQDHADELVQAFAARVNALKLNNLYCFSHFGGDDFALLFEFTDANLVRNELDGLMQMCERPFVTNKHPIYLKVSVGISYAPNDSKQMLQLLQHAEKAMQYVKQQGGDDIFWYNPQLDVDNDQRLQLEAELRGAIQGAEFEPYYQPKVDLMTGNIVGFEALVRWRHPTRGLLKPNHFIEAIIKHKLSFDLFSQMAIQIAKQLNTWLGMGFCQHVCINAEAAEFSQPNFFDFISKLLAEYRIYPEQLHIEMTESSLMHRHSSVQHQLSKIKNLGVKLALDDFGTGYASLSYLQEYDFDFIKIDKSFISKIISDPTQHAIVKAILDLAKALDMGVVAEGIETEAQYALLKDVGCQYGQGYWFGRPVSAATATQLLEAQHAVPNPKDT
ncbi:putative bifunctional diguanylate cyclase/phosphodiesterase [Psychrobacter aestuarii]|uniref:GGDEF domain-containing protein n=1 Tax=Psychrobacter aestuarii TaxID=556327 RepID=A0ABN0VNW1_9GAMM|nr:EAL domain-containing protein [Psychrobacter aestuarii]